MKAVDVLNIIDERSPFSAACDWDNSGFQVGDKDQKVTKLLVALDLGDEVIEHACEMGADMIVTHHPLIFSPLKRVTSDDFIAGRVLKLIKNNIAYACAHTNYDIFGMAQLAADRLMLKDTEVLSVEDVTELPEGVFGEQGIGRAGRIAEPERLCEYAETVRETFGLSHVSYFGNPDTVISKVACCPGSGKSVINDALYLKADVLVTGDIDHHSGIDATSRGLSIIDAGHYGIEHIFIKDMTDYLASRVDDGVEVVAEPLSFPINIVTGQEA